MQRSITALLFGVAILLGTTQARAAILSFEALLDGPSWLPDATVNTPGTGSASVEIDTALHTMSVHIEFADLLGATTASHIHCCTAAPLTGLAGVATTTPTFAGFPLGVTSGVYDRVLDLTLASSFNPAFVNNNGGTPASAEQVLIDAMLEGKTYVVVHSQFRPAGEIRGFLQQVPEPGTLALLALGLGTAMLFRRRRAG
jgi:hypothetical protein